MPPSKLLLSGVQETSKTVYAIGIALDHLPKHEGDTLLLEIAHILVTHLKESREWTAYKILRTRTTTYDSFLWTEQQYYSHELSTVWMPAQDVQKLYQSTHSKDPVLNEVPQAVNTAM